MVSVQTESTSAIGESVLRVHFTAEDLLHTRFATAPAPLMELGMALATLQRDEVLFERWRREAGAGLPRAARPLFQLVPANAAGPLFIDPISDGIDDGVDAVLSTPMGFVHRELRRVFAAGQPITPWVRALDEGDSTAWQVLGDALRAAYGAVICPSWQRVWKSFRTEIALRGRLIAEQGIQATLETLYPGTRWQGTALLFDVDSQLTVRPDGRGVTLLPSAFWTGRPMVGTHPDRSALIVYPAITPLPLVDGAPAGDPLADLLGRTRAAVLALTVERRTTGALARELGISAASVSEHTRTLRSAGLIVTERAGKAVLHSMTPLGDRLLARAGSADRRQASPPTVPTPAAATSSRR
jgi:DNA-binding transcriptional ArsR family regulator